MNSQTDPISTLQKVSSKIVFLYLKKKSSRILGVSEIGFVFTYKTNFASKVDKKSQKKVGKWKQTYSLFDATILKLEKISCYERKKNNSIALGQRSKYQIVGTKQFSFIISFIDNESIT